MTRIGEHPRRLAGLDNLSVLHHDHLVSDPPHDVEIMGDEQHRHAELGLQVLEQLSICACTVTSSAVVGSSAIRRSGRLASAIAIITRCRCPPESWWI